MSNETNQPDTGAEPRYIVPPRGCEIRHCLNVGWDNIGGLDLCTLHLSSINALLASARLSGAKELAEKVKAETERLRKPYPRPKDEEDWDSGWNNAMYAMDDTITEVLTELEER